MTHHASGESHVFDPFRPPMVGAQTWQRVMSESGFQCECTGQCGRTHAKSEGRCLTEHGSAHRLAVVAADPLVSLLDATTGAELVALCATCQTGAKRAATKAADAKTAQSIDQLDLFGDVA